MKRKPRLRSTRPRPAVPHRDGAPPTELDPDCPVCALLATRGEQVLTVDEVMAAMFAAVHGPPPATVAITLTAAPTIAPLLGAARRELDVPRGCRAADLLDGLRVMEPRLGRAFPRGGLELHADGRRLGAHAILRGGPVTLVATQVPLPTTS